jgi:hypothetical protein
MGVKRLTKLLKKFHALGWTLRSSGWHSAPYIQTTADQISNPCRPPRVLLSVVQSVTQLLQTSEPRHSWFPLCTVKFTINTVILPFAPYMDIILSDNCRQSFPLGSFNPLALELDI